MRDAAAFADPYRFDLSRIRNPHASFGGGGPHTCLGAYLARLEIGITFEELFARLPDIEVDGDPVPVHSNVSNALSSLPCSYTPA